KFRLGPIQITWGGDFECRITCPVGTDLQLSGGSTDLRVGGGLGTALGKEARGDHLVRPLGAEASLVTVSGDLRVERVGTTLTARAVSGDVTIGRIAAAVGLSTAPARGGL